MIRSSKRSALLLLVCLIGAVVLGACQGGQISIDLGGAGAGDGESSAANQTLFILMIVLLVAMFAMVLVAVSSR